MRLIYLAGPYTHKDKDIMQERVDQTIECLAYFCNHAKGLCLYSPVVHWNQVATKHTLPHDFTYWIQQDFHMIKKSTAMWILTLDGWQGSYGLGQEVEYADSINREILYVKKEKDSFVLTDTSTDDALPLQF
jgi:Domain of unknown function (DUF1937)